MNKKRKITIIIVIVVVALLCAAAAYWFITNTRNTSNENTAKRDYTELTEDVSTEKLDTNADFTRIFTRYGEESSRTMNEVRMSNPTEWDAAMVEKAYFVIAYSQKVSEYPTVDRTLLQIKTAQDAGVNVDIESIGANQAYRDALRVETDDALSNPDYLPTDTVREL